MLDNDSFSELDIPWNGKFNPELWKISQLNQDELSRLKILIRAVFRKNKIGRKRVSGKEIEEPMMMLGYFQMDNILCRIVSDTSLYMCEIYVDTMFMACP